MLLLSDLLLHESRFPPKNVTNFSSLKSLCHRLANRKELGLSQEKYILQNSEGHGHWHCKDVTF